jgi:hypothetical protein
MEGGRFAASVGFPASPPRLRLHQTPAIINVVPARAKSPAGQRRPFGKATIASSSPEAAGSVRLRPAGVTSKIQASANAMGNPVSAMTTPAVMTESGRSRAGMRRSKTCSTMKAAPP